MAEGETPFRFLSDKEFLTLSVRERAAYLSRASQELEARLAGVAENEAILRTTPLA